MLDSRKREESQKISRTRQVTEWWGHLLREGELGLKQFEYGGHTKLSFG